MKALQVAHGLVVGRFDAGLDGLAQKCLPVTHEVPIRWDVQDIDGGVQRVVHEAKLASLTVRDEGDGGSFAAGTTGSADAVDIGMHIVGQVEVDHVGDVVHVEAAGSDVGCNDKVEVSGAEASQNPLASPLGQVSMECVDGDATLGQLVGGLRAAEAGACKYQRRTCHDAFQHAAQRIYLLVLRHHQAKLLDVVDRQAFALGLDFDRVMQVIFGYPGNGWGHGCREKHDLAVGRSRIEHFAHVIDEAHAQHFVRFVENNTFDVAELERLLGHVIKDPPRGAYHDGWCVFERLDLGWVGGAAVNGDHPNRGQVTGVAPQGFGHLQSKLAGGAKDNGAGATLRRDGLLQQGESKSSRFARAGAGAADNISSLKQRRHGLGLDGGWRGKIQALECAENAFV